MAKKRTRRGAGKTAAAKYFAGRAVNAAFAPKGRKRKAAKGRVGCKVVRMCGGYKRKLCWGKRNGRTQIISNSPP